MRSLGAVVIILLLVGCAARRVEKHQTEWLEAFGRIAPAGTIALNDSLYYDRIEVTNFSWLEYEYWMKDVFGDGSLERRSTFLDTAGWYRNTPPDSSYAVFYLRHAAYRDYPVVGVTHEQAVAYGKWRSDRVMEVYLVRAGIIPFRKDQMPEDHFTIERFYSTDSLRAYHHLPYPSYALPTHAEWRAAVAMADSLARVNLPRCRRFETSTFRGAKFTECSDVVRDGRFIINSREVNDQAAGDRVAPTDCSRCEEDLIWQLRGNVSEMSADSSFRLGGDWTDPLDSILLDQPFSNNAPHVATGFRNVCRWRKWDGVR